MRIKTISAALAVLSMTAPALGQSEQEGGLAGPTRCVACHGLAGLTANPTFPHLAGQNAAYLQTQLERFRSGQRYDPLMTPIAQSLTEPEVAALARYFESLRSFATASADR